MARSLTVLIKTVESIPRSAALEFNTRDKAWEVFGSASDIFKSKKGKYEMIGLPGARLCTLRKADSLSNVGDLRGGFEPDTVAPGVSGSGNADIAFMWTADKAVEI